MDWLWQHLLSQPERVLIAITIFVCWWKELLIFGIPIGAVIWIIW